MAAFLLHHSVMERKSILFKLLLIRTLIPFLRVPSSWSNYVPKVLPSNAITLGIRALMCEFGREVYKYSAHSRVYSWILKWMKNKYYAFKGPVYNVLLEKVLCVVLSPEHEAHCCCFGATAIYCWWSLFSTFRRIRGRGGNPFSLGKKINKTKNNRILNIQKTEG
jgi:hypothetical protein